MARIFAAHFDLKVIPYILVISTYVISDLLVHNMFLSEKVGSAFECIKWTLLSQSTKNGTRNCWYIPISPPYWASWAEAIFRLFYAYGHLPYRSINLLVWFTFHLCRISLNSQIRSIFEIVFEWSPNLVVRLDIWICAVNEGSIMHIISMPGLLKCYK